MTASLKVKICGITSLEDAIAAVEAGADALGFVFHRESPRRVAPDIVRQIVAQLPPLVLPVGVFVNEDAKVVRDVMDQCALALAQIHGDESPSYCREVGRPVLRAIRLRDRAGLADMAGYQEQACVRGFVVDAYSEQAFGGTGERVDWALAAEAARTSRVLLAGGLTPENVQEAVIRVRPYGVDVSSGVEARPGMKDRAKVMAFVRAAKLASTQSGGYTALVE